MSIQAVNWAIETRVGDPVLKVLLITLANYANQWDQTWHCQETIAHDSEISVRTLRRRLHELVDMGLISVEERRRDDGRRTSSMITLVRGRPALPANLADGTTGQKEGVPPATTVAGHRIVNNRNKDSRPAKQDTPYSEEFENEVWQPYPRKAGTSKKKGWDMFRMLSSENQARVKAAIPAYAEMMRKEGRPEDKIKHLQFWISERVYETIGVSARSSGSAAPSDWHKTASRRQWEGVLMTWLNLGAKDADWRKVWGPRPGELGCGLPDDMLDRFNLEHRGYLFSKVEYESLKSKVENSRVVA